MKLGPPQYYRLAHIGEEPRAYVQLKPKPRSVRIPFRDTPTGRAMNPNSVFAFGLRPYPFEWAVTQGFVKAEDYYEESIGIQPPEPWPLPERIRR